MEEQSLLLDYIRPVQSGDEKLPEYSHSRLECYTNCPYQFDLKYNQNKISKDTTLALEFGSICHLCLEFKGKMLINGKVDYDFLEKTAFEGGMSDDGRGNALKLAGINDLKKKYWQDWATPDSEGHDYNYKVDTFLKILHTEMEENDEWEPYQFEKEFRFVFNERAIFKGFIDRIDIRKTELGYEYRLVDYKTSKKRYDDSKTTTSQQFLIYNMALLLEYGHEAVENQYRFICIDDRQLALTKGWQKRGIQKLNKIFDQIDEGYEKKLWIPKSSPLCYYCTYSNTNPQAKQYKRECEYFSLWKPSEKTFEVNKKFDPENKDEPKRKLKFDF